MIDKLLLTNSYTRYKLIYLLFLTFLKQMIICWLTINEFLKMMMPQLSLTMVLYNSAILDGSLYSPLTNGDSENINHGPTNPNFQSLNEFPQLLDLPDTGVLYNFRTSPEGKSNFFLQIRHKGFHKKTRTKNELLPQPRKDYCLFPPSPLFAEKNHSQESWIKKCR